MNLFCGVAVPRPVIPRFYRVWLYPLNPLTRLIGGMAVAEIHGLNVTCKPSEYIRFNSPPGQDCGAYMSKFFASGGPGYLAQNATNVCEYCSYKVGDEFLSTLQLNFDNRWRDLGIFAVYVGTNVMLLLIGVSLSFIDAFYSYGLLAILRSHDISSLTVDKNVSLS
jgi:ATP-binding cassette subfamily G (WHITE) protein 2 (SNQ2)